MNGECGECGVGKPQSSEYTGVHRPSGRSGFYATAWENGRQKHVGVFAAEVAAAHARDEEMRKVGAQAQNRRKGLHATRRTICFLRCNDLCSQVSCFACLELQSPCMSQLVMSCTTLCLCAAAWQRRRLQLPEGGRTRMQAQGGRACSGDHRRRRGSTWWA